MKQNVFRKVGPQRFRLRIPGVDFLVTFNLNWRTKPHPLWFFRNYKKERSWTLQVPFVEIFGGR